MSFLARHHRLWDVSLAVVLSAMLLLEVVGSNQDVPARLAVPVALLMTLPLVWRRRTPVAVAAVVLGAWVVQSLAGDWSLEPQSGLLVVATVMWSLGAYTQDSRAIPAAAVALLAVLAHQYDDFIVLGPLMAGVFAAGRLLRSRDKLARALERDRAEGERLVVAEERARIARELHDVVAHSISLITVNAGAQRLALGDEQSETREVLLEIETEGRQALTEMRRFLDVLHGSGEEPQLGPQPGLAQLAGLAERMQRAGLEVELQVEGRPTSIAPSLDITAYRIVQEALTNVLRHAGARSATVRVAHHANHLELEVCDDGTGTMPSGETAGRGLGGVRERVALFRGEVEMGPRPGGGWRLCAQLPKEAPA